MDQENVPADTVADKRLSRGQALRRVASVGTGMAAAIALGDVAQAKAAPACTASMQEVLDAALSAERLAMTCYYTALTTPAIIGDVKLAGRSADPNAVAANGNASNVAYLQAALAQERQHARLLTDAGATVSGTHFYFPLGTFERLGYTRTVNTFLWVVDRLETTLIGLYLAAIQRFGALNRTDLALLAVRMLGVECEHRLLYRIVANDAPANNLTLEVRSFDCIGDLARVLTPFRTGQGFPGGRTPPIPVPKAEQTTAVIGAYSAE